MSHAAVFDPGETHINTLQMCAPLSVTRKAGSSYCTRKELTQPGGESGGEGVTQAGTYNALDQYPQAHV